MTDLYVIIGGEYEGSCNRTHQWVQEILDSRLTADKLCDTLNATAPEDYEYWVEDHELVEDTNGRNG